MSSRKCLIKLCPNTNDQGVFEGALCVPCVNALEGGCSTASRDRILASLLDLNPLNLMGLDR